MNNQYRSPYANMYGAGGHQPHMQAMGKQMPPSGQYHPNQMMPGARANQYYQPQMQHQQQHQQQQSHVQSAPMMQNAAGYGGGQRQIHERMQTAANLLEELTRQKFPVQFQNVRECNDIQRLLQTLTNTAFVENKNHNMLTKTSNNDQKLGEDFAKFCGRLRIYEL